MIEIPLATSMVMRDVAVERAAQDAKWGEQNHPDGTRHVYAHEARIAKDMTDRAARNGTLTWRDILWEEVAKAFAESDPAKLRTELMQVAAVAVAQIEHIDRRPAVGACGGQGGRCTSPLGHPRAGQSAGHDFDYVDDSSSPADELETNA